MNYELIVNENQNKRIDKYLAENTEFSRSTFKTLINKGEVLVNNKAIKSSYIVQSGDLIVFNYIEDKIKLIPKNIDFEILKEDDHILFINKGKDIIVHPANNDQQDTLVNGLIYKYNTLGNMNSHRPGIVHRLDKDTTGVLVVAKSDEAYEKFVESFSSGLVDRKYYALVHGNIDTNLKINKPIGRNERDRTKMGINYKNGKEAISIVKPIENFENYTLIEVTLKTGRTHQIRVHLSDINHPVVGDLVYGYPNEFNVKTQLLHCYFLGFNHPIRKDYVSVETNVPEYFKEVIRRIERWKGF